VNVLPLNVPRAVAVFDFAPSAASTGPTTHVAVGSSVAEATGNAGNVDGLLLVCQAQAAGSTPAAASTGSLTPNGSSGTSPVFSTVKR